MSHQGNTYLSYNLSLVVGVARGSRKEGPLDAWKDRVGQEFRNAVTAHMTRRFNKGKNRADLSPKETRSAERRQRVVEDVSTKRVKVFWGKSPLSQCDCWAKEIESRVPKRPGVIRVFLFPESEKDRDDAARTDRYRDRLLPLFRKRDPEIRVEWFHVDSPANGADYMNDNHPLYHLASRICGALVEYVMRHTRVPPATKTEGKGFLRSIDVVAMGGKSNVAPNDPEGLVVKKILDIRDAIELVCEGLDGSMKWVPPVPRHLNRLFDARENDQSPAKRVPYKFPFGLWFRGQARVCHDLSPTLFREKKESRLHAHCDKTTAPSVKYDESIMIHHFMLHTPQFRQEYRTWFEWLCLMAHYNAPTRLLDWSEDILTALYFAVRQPEIDCDGAVWVLNASRLNERTRVTEQRPWVCLPDSSDVLLRSAMAVSHTKRDLRDTLLKQGHIERLSRSLRDKRSFVQWLNWRSETDVSSVWNRLAEPVAVFPGRMNARVTNQQAAFTLHGGKYSASSAVLSKQDTLPETKSLIDLHKSGPRCTPFLDVFIVPSCAKRKLREQLKRLGVHVARVFPELEYQAEYIKHQWRYGSD